MDSALVSVGLPIALAIIMFGLGLSLTPADFARIGRSPKAVVIILLVQVVLLPLVAFGLAKGFRLEPALAVGLLILAASPGGTTANLYSHLFRGDVALNITLTAINSILALVTLPLVVNLALNHFGAGSDTVGIQPGKMIQVFAIVLVPVALGMLVRAKAPGFADRMDKPVRIASAILLALVVIGAIHGEEKAVDYFLQVGLVTSLFCVTSLVVGYAVPRIAGLTVPQSIASGFEIGIHNSTLAIAVALTVLENTTMAIPSAIYGIVMFPIAAIFGFVLVRMVRPPADSTAKAA